MSLPCGTKLGCLTLRSANRTATINAQPLETYLQYAERERLREENDYRPIPDAPWTVLLKRITREGVAVTPNTPGQKRTRQRRPRKAVTSWVGSLRRSGSRLLDETRRYSTTSTSQSHGDESKDMTTELELAVRGDGEDSDIISPHERETAYRYVSNVQLLTSTLTKWHKGPALESGHLHSRACA